MSGKCAAAATATTFPVHRRPGLDLLRAIAVVWVMLFHSFLVGGLGEQWSWLSRYGWMGVDLFFALSGYLIGGQVLAMLDRDGRMDWRDFYLRRALRILPAFWVVLAIYLLFPGWREVEGMAPWWTFATFTMNLNVDYATQQAFSHAWSLCVEEHFYLLLPILALLLVRRDSARLTWTVALAVLLGGMVLRTAIWLHDDALQPDRAWFIEDLYYPTWCRLDGLLVGVMLAVWQRWRPRSWQACGRHAWWATLLASVLLAVAMALTEQRTSLLANSIGWPIIALAMGAFVFAGAQVAHGFGRWRIPGAAWLAAAAYSLYLSHKLVFAAVHRTASDAAVGGGIAAFALYAVATLLAGALLYYAVERPFLRMRGRRLQRVDKATAGQADAAAFER